MPSSTDDSPRKAHDAERALPPFWLVVLAVLLAWLAAGAAVWFSLGGLTERGQFGDMFGAVNALFSGLAMAGVIYAVYLQRTELVLQRHELKAQREEMSKTVGAQTRQLHITIQSLAIEHEELAKVWSYRYGLTPVWWTPSLT